MQAVVTSSLSKVRVRLCLLLCVVPILLREIVGFQQKHYFQGACAHHAHRDWAGRRE